MSSENWVSKSSFTLFIYLCTVGEGVHTHSTAWLWTSEDNLNWFPPSTMLGPGLAFRSWGLVANTFTYWAISLALNCLIVLCILDTNLYQMEIANIFSQFHVVSSHRSFVAWVNPVGLFALFLKFTLHPNISAPSHCSAPSHRFPPPHFSFTSEKQEPSLGINTPSPAHRVTAGLGTSSPTEARQGSPVMGMKSTGRQQSQEQRLPQLLRDPHEDQAAHLLHMFGKPRSSLCWLFGWWFSLWVSPRVQVSWLCWSSCGISVLNFSIRFPKLHLMFRCGVSVCFHYLLGGTSQRTVMLGSSLQP